MKVKVEQFVGLQKKLDIYRGVFHTIDVFSMVGYLESRSISRTFTWPKQNTGSYTKVMSYCQQCFRHDDPFLPSPLRLIRFQLRGSSR